MQPTQSHFRFKPLRVILAVEAGSQAGNTGTMRLWLLRPFFPQRPLTWPPVYTRVYVTSPATSFMTLFRYNLGFQSQGLFLP